MKNKIEKFEKQKNKVDLNLQDFEKRTALHFAVINEDVFMVYKLLIKGANCYLKNEGGLTPYKLSKNLNNEFIQKLFVF